MTQTTSKETIDDRHNLAIARARAPKHGDVIETWQLRHGHHPYVVHVKLVYHESTRWSDLDDDTKPTSGADLDHEWQSIENGRFVSRIQSRYLVRQFTEEGRFFWDEQAAKRAQRAAFDARIDSLLGQAEELMHARDAL
jgi:hypothetical protein